MTKTRFLGQAGEAQVARTVNIGEAKAKLSALVDEALAGEEVVLARAGRPVARIVALPQRGRRPKGLLAHWKGGDPDAVLQGISQAELDAMEAEWDELYRPPKSPA
jgi:prevent-host-death family protein